MPTYDYQCLDCENIVERVKKIADRDTVEDIECFKCDTVGNYKRIITSVSSHVGESRPRPDPIFRDMMTGIKKASGRDCTIPDY